MKAPLPPDEQERLEALHRYAVLDTPAEESFDDLALLAAQICQTPIALVSLVDESRQWFKARIGMSLEETSRDMAFCAHTILHKDKVLEVRDAEADPRFVDNPLVTSEPHVRFYAGAPLTTPDGQAIGALCVMDSKPRKLTDEQLEALRALSRHVVSQLELHRKSLELAHESVVRRRADKVLRRQFDELSAGKDETDRLLALAHKSRRALLSVLEDERLAGQKLRESEERFRLLAENIQEVFWITDPASSRMLYVSPAYERTWGRTRAELYASPDTWLDSIHPEDRQAVWRDVATGLTKGTYDVEYRIARPDGVVRWIRDRAFPVVQADGSVDRIVGVARDVTERKEAEDVLKESERRFREMLENVELIAMTLDKAGRVTFCNDYMLKLTGWTREEVIGADWGGKFIPGSPEITRLFHKTIESGAIPAHFQNPIQTRDGRLRDIVWNNTMLRDGAGKIVGTASIGEDVTERERAMARVREQAEMLDHAHEAIVVRDIHTRRITYWNLGAERLYGWTAEEAMGKDMGELIFAIPEAVDRVTRETIETGEWRGEHRQIAKDGRQLTVSSHVTLVRDADGTPKSALVINIDITSRKQLEEQLLRTQRLESIGTLASGVAHDLNNILSPIMMAAPMLREDLPGELKETLLGTIEASAHRGAEIVKQVLTFARGVRGERTLVQPAHLIDEMVKISAQTFPKSITVTSRHASGTWAVHGDATQLHQVLLNLCVNARDAMPNGGELVVSLENFTVDEQFAGMVAGSKAGPHVVIAVSDTGNGIPREILDKIFDPFFTTKEVGTGTGLGLSTVIGIVKSHEGFLTVESEPGRGTTFKVYLPASETQGAAGSAAENASMPMGHGELILVVDDEESIRKVTRTILEKHGYLVVTAADGTDALGIFAAQMQEIRVVLTDVMMPFMDGVALARVLHRMRPETPLIACSGQCDEAREAKLREAGVRMFLRKPYTRGSLMAALRTVLGGGGGGGD
jgi:PAS domain S-box-containing protein